MLGMQLDFSTNLENINSIPHCLCPNCLSYFSTFIRIRRGPQGLRSAVSFPLEMFLSSFCQHFWTSHFPYWYLPIRNPSSCILTHSFFPQMVGTKLFSFLTFPFIKQVSTAQLQCLTETFSHMTRHYGLGKTALPWSFADQGIVKGMSQTYIFPAFERYLNFSIMYFGLVR